MNKRTVARLLGLIQFVLTAFMATSLVWVWRDGSAAEVW